MRSFVALVAVFFLTMLISSAAPPKVTVHKDPLPKGFADVQGENIAVTDTVYAYDFEVKTIDGKSIKLVDYRGKWVFIDFFATW